MTVVVSPVGQGYTSSNDLAIVPYVIDLLQAKTVRHFVDLYKRVILSMLAGTIQKRWTEYCRLSGRVESGDIPG